MGTRIAGWAVVVFVLSAAPALRAEDFFIGDGDTDALIAAVQAANAKPDEPSTIHLAPGSVYVLSAGWYERGWDYNALPTIQGRLTIEGNGATLARDASEGVPDMRIMLVGLKGEVTLNDLTLTGGRVGVGGGLLNCNIVTLHRCTIEGNTAWYHSGGLFNALGTMTLIDCTIADNTAFSHGGGIRSDGNLTMLRCRVVRNSASSSGGIVNVSESLGVHDCIIAENVGGGLAGLASPSLVTGSVIADNEASTEDAGAGIVCSREFTIRDCIIVGNAGDGVMYTGSTGPLTVIGSIVSSNGGGGVRRTQSQPVSITVEDCTIADNGKAGIDAPGTELSLVRSTISGNASVLDGGGVRVTGSAAAIVDSCTISGNTAARNGGGLFVFGSLAVTVVNSTISGNTAGTYGGGIMNSAVLTMANCTLAHNSAATGEAVRTYAALSLSNCVVAHAANGGTLMVGEYTDAGHNIVEDGIGLTHSTSFAADPRLGPLEDNGGPTRTHALLADSPGLDAGDCAGGTVVVDQRGTARPQGSACDIGSFEREAVCLADCDGDGSVGEEDFACFLGLFLAGDPGADCSGDGVVDSRDIVCFLNHFVAGCP